MTKHLDDIAFYALAIGIATGAVCTLFAVILSVTCYVMRAMA